MNASDFLGPVAALAGAIAIIVAAARGGWYSQRAYDSQAKRADKAEAERDRALDMLIQTLQTTQASQQVAREAVALVKAKPLSDEPPREAEEPPSTRRRPLRWADGSKE